MFMSGVESRCEVYCAKHIEKVDVKTCMLCPNYKKFFLTRKCHYTKRWREYLFCKVVHAIQEKL